MSTGCVFIGGCGRSGTTLLASMLGSHSGMFAVPESHFKFDLFQKFADGGAARDMLNYVCGHWQFQRQWCVPLDLEECDFVDTHCEVVEWLASHYDQHAGGSGEGVWVDHTPINTQYCSSLLNRFRNGKMIHIVRDARAVVASVRPLDWGPSTIYGAALWWVHNVAFGLAAESFWGPDRVRQVRYEDLVLKPEATLRTLCRFLQVDYVPEMVVPSGFRVPAVTQAQHFLIGQPLDKRRVDGWKKKLTPRQIEIIESVTKDILPQLGYEPMFGLTAKKVNTLEFVGTHFQEAYRRAINKLQRRLRYRRLSIVPPSAKSA